VLGFPPFAFNFSVDYDAVVQVQNNQSKTIPIEVRADQ